MKEESGCSSASGRRRRFARRIAALRARDRRHDPDPDDHQRADDDPRMRHVNQICAISDTREQDEETQDVKPERRHGAIRKVANRERGEGRLVPRHPVGR